MSMSSLHLFYEHLKSTWERVDAADSMRYANDLWVPGALISFLGSNIKINAPGASRCIDFGVCEPGALISILVLDFGINARPLYQWKSMHLEPRGAFILVLVWHFEINAPRTPDIAKSMHLEAPGTSISRPVHPRYIDSRRLTSPGASILAVSHPRAHRYSPSHIPRCIDSCFPAFFLKSAPTLTCERHQETCLQICIFLKEYGAEFQTHVELVAP